MGSANFLRLRDDSDAGMRQALHIFSDAETSASQQAVMNNLCTLSMSLMTIRVMKVLDFSPRIGLVKRTISRAAVDLAHFFAIFFLLGGGFAILGWLNFGADVEGFSTLWSSVYSVWMWLNGDFAAFDDIRTGGVYATVGSIYFILFQGVVFFVLLNILLAIICDCYAEVKEETGDADTMPQEIRKVCTGIYRESSLHKSPNLRTIEVQNQLHELLEKLKGAEEEQQEQEALHVAKKANAQELHTKDFVLTPQSIKDAAIWVRQELSESGKNSDRDIDGLLEIALTRLGRKTRAESGGITTRGDEGGAKILPEDDTSPATPMAAEFDEKSPVVETGALVQSPKGPEGKYVVTSET